ncbi:MAG: hypothetical protein V1792_03295 [Pseudomonadota bacterium]
MRGKVFLNSEDTIHNSWPGIGPPLINYTAWTIRYMNKRMHSLIVENGRFPGALRHMMTAGIERTGIFRDEEDRDELLDTLESLLPVTQQPWYGRLQIPERALGFEDGWPGTWSLVKSAT